MLKGGGLLWRWTGRAYSGRRAVLWLWVIAAVFGPMVFDLWRGTYTGAVMRYGIGGLPAALLLASLGVVRLPRWAQVGVLVVVLLAWSSPLRMIHYKNARCNEPFAVVAGYVDDRAGADTVVVMHSIPSGVTSLARYMESDAPIYAWVGQLNERTVPDVAAALMQRYELVILIDLHAVGEPMPQEAFFREAGEVVEETKVGGARIIEFKRR